MCGEKVQSLKLVSLRPELLLHKFHSRYRRWWCSNSEKYTANQFLVFLDMLAALLSSHSAIDDMKVANATLKVQRMETRKH